MEPLSTQVASDRALPYALAARFIARDTLAAYTGIHRGAIMKIAKDPKILRSVADAVPENKHSIMGRVS